MNNTYNDYSTDGSLMHYGIKGMKWKNRKHKSSASGYRGSNKNKKEKYSKMKDVIIPMAATTMSLTLEKVILPAMKPARRNYSNEKILKESLSTVPEKVYNIGKNAVQLAYKYKDKK